MSCGCFRFLVVVKKVWKPQPPPEGGAHLGHVLRGQTVQYRIRYFTGSSLGRGSYAVSAVAWSCVRVCRWVWMVVRFVCVIRVPVCARVSCVCPGSPGVFLPVVR